MTRRFPTPEEYGHAPELAVLSILDSTLHAVTCAMLAAHLDICQDDERPYWVAPPPDSAETRCAEALLACADRLHAAISIYHRTVAAALKESLLEGHDIPF